MTLLALDYPPFEYLIVAVAVLIGLIGRIVEFAKQFRQKSIDAEQKAEAQFGAELEEAPEPAHQEVLPPRLELASRPPRPRREEFLPVAAPPPPPPQPTRAAAPKPWTEHEILRLLRTRHGAKSAVVLAEILGRPRALRRGR